MFKERFGRNPFNVGTEDKSAQPAPAENIGSNTPRARPQRADQRQVKFPRQLTVNLVF